MNLAHKRRPTAKEPQSALTKAGKGNVAVPMFGPVEKEGGSCKGKLATIQRKKWEGS